MRAILFLFTVLLMQQACVPSRVAEDLRSDKDSLQRELTDATQHNQALAAENDSLKTKLKWATKQLKSLRQDTALMQSTINKLRRLNNELNKYYDQMISNKKEIISDKAEKTKELLDQLNRLKESMQEKEQTLVEKERILHDKTQQLDSLRKNLQKRQERVRELEGVLAQKDSTLQALKKTVSDALINLRGSGLSVKMKNSKVYVSMEEKLLFASGKYQLDKEGKDALDKISQVLKNNPKVNIMVEGHTDDQKMLKGSEIEDNWELSVLRSTEVVRYITEQGGVKPERLIAAGRGPYAPVVPNTSEENRRKNRRTEIILTPEMDKLFEILQTNPQE